MENSMKPERAEEITGWVLSPIPFQAQSEMNDVMDYILKEMFENHIQPKIMKYFADLSVLSCEEVRVKYKELLFEICAKEFDNYIPAMCYGMTAYRMFTENPDHKLNIKEGN